MRSGLDSCASMIASPAGKMPIFGKKSKKQKKADNEAIAELQALFESEVAALRKEVLPLRDLIVIMSSRVPDNREQRGYQRPH